MNELYVLLLKRRIRDLWTLWLVVMSRPANVYREASSFWTVVVRLRCLPRDGASCTLKWSVPPAALATFQAHGARMQELTGRIAALAPRTII